MIMPRKLFPSGLKFEVKMENKQFSNFMNGKLILCTTGKSGLSPRVGGNNFYNVKTHLHLGVWASPRLTAAHGNGAQKRGCAQKWLFTQKTFQIKNINCQLASYVFHRPIPVVFFPYIKRVCNVSPSVEEFYSILSTAMCRKRVNFHHLSLWAYPSLYHIFLDPQAYIHLKYNMHLRRVWRDTWYFLNFFCCFVST